MKHTWTADEICTVTEYYIDTFIVQKKKQSKKTTICNLQTLLPNISSGSIGMKIQNCKALEIEYSISGSLNISPLRNASKEHREMFRKTLCTKNIIN